MNLCIEQKILYVVLIVYVSADVRLPPHITDHPGDVIFRTDESFVLECVAEGVPIVEFEWTKDGDILESANPAIKSVGGPNSGSIRIEYASSDNEGYYQCSAWNQWGRALSRVAVVRRALINFDSDPSVEKYSATVGKPLKVKCETGNTFPEPSIKWALSDSVAVESVDILPSSARVQIDLEGNLHFMNILTADDQDGKIYKCLITNPDLDLTAGGSYSEIVVIEDIAENIEPNLVYPEKNYDEVIALHKEEIILKCLFSGYPTPAVNWKKKNGQLPSGRYRLTDHNTQLTIENVQFEDEGDYECTGTNTIDSSSHVITMRVQSVPVFAMENGLEQKPMNLNKTEGESASFLCKVDAKPDADIQWYVNGKEVHESNPGPRRTITNGGTNFTVHDICKDCGGGLTDLIVVQCNASNIHGYAYAQGYLNVLKRTLLTSKPADVEMIEWEDLVTFECDAESDASTPWTLIWKRDDVQIDTSRPEYELDGTNLHVYPLEESDPDKRDKIAGKYKCVASNGYSTASASAQLTFPIVPPPIKEGGVTIADFWWIFLIIVIIILLILLLLLCYVCYKRNKGDEYDVDEKDRKNGFDPEKELVESSFQDFQRSEPTEGPYKGSMASLAFKGSMASLASTNKFDTDDERSQAEGQSFLGPYNDKSRQYDESFA